MLLCIGFFGIVLQIINSFDRDGLVYCPLQKKWVEENQKQIPVENPLDEICAVEETKHSYLKDLVTSINLIPFNSASFDTEKLFFEYSAKGYGAFAELGNQQQFPNRDTSILTASERSSGAYKNEFVKKQSSDSVELNSLRPPNFSAVSTKFEFPPVYKRTRVSLQILARPPPVKLS